MNELLYKYFFFYIDRGIAQNATPLFTGIYNGESLIKAISHDYLELRESEVAELIFFAQREVEL